MLEIRDAGEKGKGLFAAKSFRAGETVVEMKGTIYTTAELTDDLMAMQIGPDSWLCSTGMNVDDYANHSCNPNTGFCHSDLRLIALRDIPAGEEITWDYSTSINEPDWSLNCHCGSTSCRKVICSWFELSAIERERLKSTALAYLRNY